ncbi:MAG: hypothetical protein AAF419_02710, partial [Pseudomonadota bacterium]
AECTKEEAIESESTAAYIKTWQELDTHFSKYGHCDDGAIAAGYSESVSLLMETKWSEFLSYKMENNFLHFVINHIDETWDMDRVNKVTSLAEKNCNVDKKEICDEILELSY